MILDGWMALALLACYAIGSIPFGLLVAKTRGVDIRAHGSGNIGATNVSRVLGRRYGLIVFVLDAAKGFGPTLLAGRMLQARSGELNAAEYGVWLSAAGLTVLGHVYPVYVRFRGGKGVATALGATLGIHPYLTWPCVICIGLWVVVTAATRYVSLGSLSAAAAFPIAVWLMQASSPGGWRERWPLAVYAVAQSGLVIYRHRHNIQRLRGGTENRVGPP